MSIVKTDVIHQPATGGATDITLVASVNPDGSTIGSNTRFDQGRDFRTFKEFSIASGATYVIKIVNPIDVILSGLTVYLDAGNVRIATIAGGTSGGAFSEVLPIIMRNTMSTKPVPIYNSQLSITAGGTHTGGTVIDVIRLKADTNTNRAVTVGAISGDERGVGAGTYYYVFTHTGNDTATGVFSLRWEENLRG